MTPSEPHPTKRNNGEPLKVHMLGTKYTNSTFRVTHCGYTMTRRLITVTKDEDWPQVTCSYCLRMRGKT